MKEPIIRDSLFDELLKYYFLNTSVVLYISAFVILFILFVITLQIIRSWSDEH